MDLDMQSFIKTKKYEKEVFNQWYHTINLGDNGVTDGIYDLRTLFSKYGFPNLKGKRVLDVGCSDGFFSFEFEKMGGNVVSIDSYYNKCFDIAKKSLGSNVDYRILNVYDISNDNLGFFDFVFCGTLLLHLENPILALRKIKSVINKGVFICANPVFKNIIQLFYHFLGKKFIYAKLNYKRASIGYVPTYWIPSEDCLYAMLFKAGFDNICKINNFYLNGFSKAKNKIERHYHVVFKIEVD